MNNRLLLAGSIIHNEAYRAKSNDVRLLRMDKHTEVAERIETTTLNRFIAAASPLVRTYLEFPYKNAGYDVLGAGFRSTVYTTPDKNTVYKLHRASTYMDETEREELLQSYRERQATTEYYLGDFALKQTFTIDSHPCNLAKRAVIGEQPYVEFDSLPTHPTDYSDTFKQQLLTFAQRSEQMMLDTGYVVDIKGVDNIVATHDDRLVLIDTIPCDPAYNPQFSLERGYSKLKQLELHAQQ